jgi:hypothetical protein
VRERCSPSRHITCIWCCLVQEEFINSRQLSSSRQVMRLNSTGGTEAIVIKPVSDGESAEAPLAEWEDLALYAQGIATRQTAIPSDVLSLPHEQTPLPLEPAQRFIAEPYVSTDRCQSQIHPCPRLISVEAVQT